MSDSAAVVVSAFFPLVVLVSSESSMSLAAAIRWRFSSSFFARSAARIDAVVVLNHAGSVSLDEYGMLLGRPGRGSWTLGRSHWRGKLSTLEVDEAADEGEVVEEMTRRSVGERTASLSGWPGCGARTRGRSLDGVWADHGRCEDGNG